MTKEEKIKEEWDKLTPNSKLHICKNTGFVITYCINGIDDLIDNSIIKESDIEFEYLEADLIQWRPKSLQGIENNNGWIKIESESDLPEYGYYEVVERKTGKHSRSMLDNVFGTRINLKYYSHYQKITELKPAIY